MSNYNNLDKQYINSQIITVKTIDELMNQVKQGYITKESVINIPFMFTRCSTKNHINKF